MPNIKVSTKSLVAAAMAALTIFASLSFAGCKKPLAPENKLSPVSEVATPVIPVPGNFSGVAEETSTENNVEASSQQTSEVSAENSVEDYAQQPPDSGTHAGSDASNYKVEDYDILYLKDVSFLTMSAYGASGNIHKDSILCKPIVYKGITIPEGTVMHVWGDYGEDYAVRWYDNLVILPKSAVTLTDDPRNIYMSVGIDESSIMDIHSNSLIALPTKKLAMLEDKESFNETSSLTLYEREIIEVFDFNESDTRYLFKRDGHVWSINLPNVRFIEPTYGLYTPVYGEPSRWVRVLKEHWSPMEGQYEYDHSYTIQWGGYTRMIPGEDISVITENTDVIPKYTPFPAEFTGEISGEYGILQGTLQVDGFEQPVPAGTAVHIISIDDSGNTIINWYESQFLSISDWLVKVDEYKEGCLSDKSGPLITAGILIKGISPSSDFSYISEKYISGI